MKNNPKINKKTVKLAQKPATGYERGPYNKKRGEDGLTPRERLDTAKADAQEFENRKNLESWQTRAQAEAIAQETAEIIQADLYGTLPLSLAGKLSGRVFTPAEVRQIIRAEVDAVVKEWVKGDRVSEKSVAG